MMTKIDDFSKARNFQIRIRGWQIWYFQNLLVLITSFLIIPNFLFQFQWQLGDMSGRILNTILFVALSLDLISISLISLTSLLEVKNYKETLENTLFHFILGVSGIIWVLIGVAWRAPFFLQGPLEFGMVFTLMKTPMILRQLSEDVFFLLTLVGGSLIFLVILVLHDFLYLYRTSYKEPRIMSPSYFPNIGTIYGISNTIGTLLLVLFGVISMIDQALPEPKPDPSPVLMWVPLLIIITKLILTPLLGMRTTRKLISCSTEFYSNQKLVSDSFKGDFKSERWFKQLFQLCRPVILRPSKRTFYWISLTTVVFLILPFSPFFVMNYFPTPHIEGPFIYRNANTLEAMEVLRYVEELDLAEITGYKSFRRYGPHLMTNETLQMHLQTINTVKSGLTSRPYHMKLFWNVSLVSSTVPILDISSFSTYWVGDISYMTWWEDGNQSSEEWVVDLGQTSFSNYSHPISWVYVGEYEYSSISGPLAGIWTEVKQVLFLDNSLSLVCLVYWGHTAIS